MNVRNLIFIIVLFIVWLAGYYYYSPQQRAYQPMIPEIEMPQETETLTSTQEATSLAQQGSIPNSMTTEAESSTLTQAIAHEPLQQTAVSTQTQIVPMHKTKKCRKKRQKKIEKKQSLPAVDHPVDYSQAQPVSQHAHMTMPSSSLSDANATISIASSLVKKDIGYYKMLSWHYPYIFHLTVNGQPLFTKNDKKITQADAVQLPANEPFIIRYNYEWHTPWGKRIGAKKVTFKPNADAQKLSVAFKSNWKDEERIVVDGATKISAEALEEEAAP